MRFGMILAADGRWSIADENQQVLLSGTYRECEDWLDARENGHPVYGTGSLHQPEPGDSLLQTLAQRLLLKPSASRSPIQSRTPE